jgi:FlaA1/EpsC-like NDP-sugar epimerase
MAARAMLDSPEAGFLPVAFIDDDPAKRGTSVEGIPVIGGRGEIPEALRRTGADEILIALPSLGGTVIREIIDVCRSERAAFRIVPGIWEIIRGDVRLEQIRGVEPEDLLGRETVEPDPSLLAGAYRGKRVLVTGAGGSIGRELARQILSLEPERLVLLGRGENSLFETGLALAPADRGEVELALVDLRDENAMRRLVDQVRPQVVLHAAAHKHVTFLERYPEEAVLNNVVATRDLLDAAAAAGTERLVLISTDKAVHPRSVMGASKRLAEVLLAERTAAGSGPKLMAVRFGNVLGSRGSVVPLFLHQIRRGGPVTVSHPDAARYFMTVREAVTLVLEAGSMGSGGEVFILEMGEQIPIRELARDLITLSGYRPEVDIPITMIGLKPGEKLREELVHDFEELVPTRNPMIRSARRRAGSPPAVGGEVDRLRDLARAADRDGIVRTLARLLPEASLAGSPASGEESNPGAPRPSRS